MKAKVFVLFMILSLIAVIAGCGGSRTYLVDVRYIPATEAPAASEVAQKAVVGVCPFDDVRKEKVKDTIGIRQRRAKQVDFVKVAGTSVSDSVTRAVKDYFSERGFQVTDCKGWDQTAEGLDRLPQDIFLAVGGRIESFMVEAKAGLATTEIQYRIKVAASIGYPGERRVVIRTMDSAPQVKKITFNPEELQATLNETLTEVIRNLFK
jgi:hypothetical protein